MFIYKTKKRTHIIEHIEDVIDALYDIDEPKLADFTKDELKAIEQKHQDDIEEEHANAYNDGWDDCLS